jgi:hypothetical protein
VQLLAGHAAGDDGLRIGDSFNVENFAGHDFGENVAPIIDDQKSDRDDDQDHEQKDYRVFNFFHHAVTFAHS